MTIVPSPTTDELVELYARADVFVLATLMGPYSGEGFGIVLAEAQLAGCVVDRATVGRLLRRDPPRCDRSAPDRLVRELLTRRSALVSRSAAMLRHALLPTRASGRAVRFSPDRYREEVAAVLLDAPPPADLDISIGDGSGDHLPEGPPERG